MKGDPVAPIQAFTGRFDSLFQGRRVPFFLFDDPSRIHRPGHDGPAAVIEVFEILNPDRLRFQLQGGIAAARE